MSSWHRNHPDFSVIGIDPSVKAPAFATWPSKETNQVEDLKTTGSERLCDLYRATWNLVIELADDDLQAIFIERPRGKFPKQALDQATGVIQVAAASAAYEYFDYEQAPTVFELSPGEWKKEIGLKGNATKDEVIAWASGHTTRDDLTSDEADALAIAAAGHSLLTKGEEQ